MARSTSSRSPSKRQKTSMMPSRMRSILLIEAACSPKRVQQHAWEAGQSGKASHLPEAGAGSHLPGSNFRVSMGMSRLGQRDNRLDQCFEFDDPDVELL